MRCAIFTIVILSSTMAYAQSHWDDATYLALQFSGEFRAPEEIVSMISSDRIAIESAYPEVAGFDLFRYFEPGRVLCVLTDAGWSEFHAGGLEPLRDLMEDNYCLVWYGYFDIKALDIFSFLPLNSPQLAALFDPLEGVQYCEAYGYTGDGSTIEVQELGASSRYLYRTAWGMNCFAGCEFQHFREFTISDGVVELTAEWGNLVSAESSSWGEVKALFR